MSRRRKPEESQGRHRAPKRQMGTYSTTSKALDDDSYEEEVERNTEELYGKQRHAQRGYESKKDKAAKSNQVKFVSQPEEGAKTDSQRFIDALKISKKNKGMKKGTKYLVDIKHIVDGQAEITGNLEAMAQQSLSLGSQFSEIFVQSYQMVMTDILSPRGIRLDHPVSLEDASMSITENGHRLLSAIDSLGLELDSHILSTQIKEQEWNDNVLNVERILEGGKRVGEAKAVTLLTGLQMQNILGGDTESSGALLGDAMNDMERVTWADAAAKQGKAVGKLASAFPRD